jgi:hypothetical protein
MSSLFPDAENASLNHTKMFILTLAVPLHAMEALGGEEV